MIIDHIGIVVQNIDSGITQWEKTFGYHQLTEIIENSKQQVRVVFLVKENSITIKLIEPIDERSTVYNFSRRGGGLHHLCFRCENLKKQIVEFVNNGLYLLVKPQSGEAFENNNIAFLLAKNNLNIELVDTDKKAKTKKEIYQYKM